MPKQPSTAPAPAASKQQSTAAPPAAQAQSSSRPATATEVCFAGVQTHIDALLARTGFAPKDLALCDAAITALQNLRLHIQDSMMEDFKETKRKLAATETNLKEARAEAKKNADALEALRNELEDTRHQLDDANAETTKVQKRSTKRKKENTELRQYVEGVEELLRKRPRPTDLSSSTDGEDEGG